MSFEQFVKHILEEALKIFSGPAEDPPAPEEAPAAPLHRLPRKSLRAGKGSRPTATSM